MKLLFFLTFSFFYLHNYTMDELSSLQKKNAALEEKIIMFNNTLALNNQQYKEQLNFIQTEGSKLLNLLIQNIHQHKKEHELKYKKLSQEIQLLRENNMILESIESKINGLQNLSLQYDTKIDRCCAKIDFLQKQILNNKQDTENIRYEYNKKITAIYDMIMRLCSREIIFAHSKIQQELIKHQDNNDKIKDILEVYSIKLLNYAFGNEKLS